MMIGFVSFFFTGIDVDGRARDGYIDCQRAAMFIFADCFASRHEDYFALIGSFASNAALCRTRHFASILPLETL